MRILFVSGLTGFSAGGVQTEMVRLVGGLRDRGDEVAFAVDRLPGGLDGVRHFPLKYPPTEQSAVQITAAAAEFKPDCVHVVGGGLNLLRPVDEMKLAVPWVFTCHNLPPFERISDYFAGSNRLHYWIRNVRAIPPVLSWGGFLKKGTFSRVIAHSQTVADHLASARCPGDKVASIPFGCEAEKPAESTDKSPYPPGAYPKILTVAGYAHHKGIHDYIAVAGRLVKRHPKLSYLIVGNSRNKPYTAFLEGLIAKLQLAKHVTLLRDAGDDVKNAALAAADLYAQPSHEEGFCLAFAEAAMVAPRLVGCRTGEIAGLADGDPAIRVVEPKDVAGVERASLELLERTVTPDEIARRVRRLEERYSWKSYLDRHRELFESVRK